MSAALQLPHTRLREPSSRELRRFVRRSWLRSFGPARNDRGAFSRRWVVMGRHRMHPETWTLCYTRMVEDLLAKAVVVVLADEGDRPIGWACYEPGDPVRFHFVFVDPAHRGQGHGRHLHDAIVKDRPVTYTHQTRREDG